MRNLGTIISAALLSAMISSCGDATGPADAESKRNDTTSGSGTGVTAPPPPAGGGTYGSGGNLMPGVTSEGAVMETAAGGGTYGSGGKAAPDPDGSNTVTGNTSSATECAEGEERGGGTYGSGGRIMECATEPTP